LSLTASVWHVSAATVARRIDAYDASMDLRQHLMLAIAATMLCDAIQALRSHAFVPKLFSHDMILQSLLLSGGWVLETDATLHRSSASECFEAILNKAGCRKLAPD
jgi:hypothetical protein